MSDNQKPNSNQSGQGKKNQNKQPNANHNTGKNEPSVIPAKPIADSKATPASAAKATEKATDKKDTTADSSKKPADSKPTPVLNSNKNSGTTTPPPPPSKPAEPKQSPLALIISIIALGLGGYALYNSMNQTTTNPEAISALEQKVSQLQQNIGSKADSSEIQKLSDNLGGISKTLDSKADKKAVNSGLDEKQVNSLIEKQLDSHQKQIEQSLQQIAAKQQKPQAAPAAAGLSKEQVNTLIKEALAGNNSGNAPAIDFSAEIDTIKQDKADIEQYLAEIKQQGDSIQNAIKQTATQAKTALDESIGNAEQKISAADNRPIPYPLINSLTLAEIAANAHQFSIAAQYLEQAADSFDALHLNQPPYAQFAGQISELQQETAKLAEQQQGQQQIDSIIANVDEWPFIDTDPANLLASEQESSPTSDWQGDLKRIGLRVLSKTVTVSKNTSAELSWINANPGLRQVIRENVRLDLGFIRNALLAGDQARAQAILSTLQEKIGRYFNTDAAQVKQALATLDSIVKEQQSVPDIASLIQSIKQAG